MELIAENIKDLPQIAKKIINYAKKKSNIWLFEGEMGAGKTTTIKAIAKELGVMNNVQSPTFSIVNEYLTDNDETIYHFDCYRLKNETEALDIGIEEYFYSGDLCFIEWAEKIPALIPTNAIKISISVDENGYRRFEMFSM